MVTAINEFWNQQVPEAIAAGSSGLIAVLCLFTCVGLVWAGAEWLNDASLQE